MNHRNFFWILLASAVLLGASCRTVRELKALAKCEFRINTVKETTLAGINVQQIRDYRDLNFAQAATVTKAYMSGNLPLSCILNVQVRNPNEQVAALNRLEWIALYNDFELVRGNVDSRVVVPPSGMSRIPIRISCNVRDVLNRLQRDKVLDSGFNLKDAQDRPKAIYLKLKPAFTIGKKGRALNYPGYITVKREFTSGD